MLYIINFKPNKTRDRIYVKIEAESRREALNILSKIYPSRCQVNIIRLDWIDLIR